MTDVSVSLRELPTNKPRETRSNKDLAIDTELAKLQHETFDYFLHETNPANGLVIDRTAANWPASIAATGLALATYPVSVERGFMTRAAAAERTLATLRFFWNSPQGPEPHATGYKGFYYHFLDMQTGRRAWQCELSTVDSTFLLAGALCVAFRQTGIFRGIEPRIHAGEDSEAPGWRQRELPFLPKAARIGSIGSNHLLEDLAHLLSPCVVRILSPPESSRLHSN